MQEDYNQLSVNDAGELSFRNEEDMVGRRTHSSKQTIVEHKQSQED